MSKNSVASKTEELVYQASRANKLANIRPEPPAVLNRYLQTRHWRYFPKEFLFHELGDLNGKKVCDLGCGDGQVAVQMAKMGAEVTAIDISPELIELVEKRAIVNDVKDRVNAIVGDVEHADLPVGSFDYVVCYDVLHHVAIAAVVPKILDMMKPGGKAIMIEPVAFSALLEKVREWAPIEKDASPLDRQLNKSEIDEIARYFARHKATYFSIFGRLARLFLNITKPKVLHRIKLTLFAFDRFLLSIIPPLWRASGIVIMVGYKENIPS